MFLPSSQAKIHLYDFTHRKFLEVRLKLYLPNAVNTISTQLYEDDARIGNQVFDLKLTQRVKMSMVRTW